MKKAMTWPNLFQDVGIINREMFDLDSNRYSIHSQLI